MHAIFSALLVLVLAGCASPGPRAPSLSTLVDLDPASTGRTVIVEGMTADREGRLHVGDRVTGNVLRIDPREPRPVVVGRIESRTIDGRNIRANAGSLVFDAQGNLLIVAAGFGEVVRLRAAELDPARPGLAQTFATGMPGANGIALDRQGRLLVSGGASGTIYRVPAGGGAGEAVAQIERHSRTLPDGRTQQAIVANGLALDAAGLLHVADTARGAIWRVGFDGDGRAQKPASWVRHPSLEGADGIGFDRDGRLWVTSNELNALVRIGADGAVTEVARNDAAGPLEFPSAVVFVGETGYVANFDTPRRVNLDAGSTDTASAGIGASILRLAR